MADFSKRSDRLQIMLTLEELRALDDWRFETLMPSRSAAVRELLRRGLAAEGYFDAAEGGSHSGEIGVLYTHVYGAD
jgi:metal-responsive CopG/Arc/MetJ family transcriptional regulator